MRAEASVSTFVNPTNQRVYHAVQMPDASYFSSGWQMVADAQKAADAYAAHPDQWWLKWDVDDSIQFIEFIRGFYDVFGYAWW